MEPLARNRVFDGVERGDDGGTFDQYGLHKTCRR